jgi:anti-sigma factor RsiW
MSDNLLDILKQRDDLTEQELLKYLQGDLTPEERRAVEEKLADSEMMSDAEEGLRMADAAKTSFAVNDINRKLALQLQQQRRKRTHKPVPNQSLVIAATFLVLLLIVLAYLVIYKMKNG